MPALNNSASNLFNNNEPVITMTFQTNDLTEVHSETNTLSHIMFSVALCIFFMMGIISLGTFSTNRRREQQSHLCDV